MIYIYRAAQHEQGQWNVSLNRQYIGTGMGQGRVKEIRCPLLILQGPPPKAATKNISFWAEYKEWQRGSLGFVAGCLQSQANKKPGFFFAPLTY